MALSTPKMDKLKMGSKLSDADTAFGSKQALKVKKQKKSQGSSRYRPVGAQELVALPLLKGMITSGLWHHPVDFLISVV